MNLSWLEGKKGYLILALTLILATAGGSWYFLFQGPPNPETLFLEAWQNTMGAESFAFESSAKLFVDGRDEELSKVNGRYVKGSLYLKGEILKTPVELYQVEGSTYLKEPTGNWLFLEDGKHPHQDFLLSEVNPLSYLVVKDSVQAELLRIEEHGDTKLYHLSVKPDIDNQFLEMLYEDFSLELWINKKGRFLDTAILQGKGKNKPEDLLTLTIVFSDINEPLEVKLPHKLKELNKQR